MPEVLDYGHCLLFHSEPIQKLAEAMTSPEVKEFLEENYPESAIPAFE